MDLLGIIDLIRVITYSFEGSKNIFHARINMKKQQVNFQQGDKKKRNIT